MFLKKSVSVAKILPKSSGLVLWLFLFWSFFGFSQLQLKDSVWETVQLKDSILNSQGSSTANYSELFYKSIKVPVLNTVPSNYKINPVAQSTKILLQQMQLDKSYSASDIKNTALESTLKEIEKLSFPFANVLSSKLASQLKLLTNKPVLVSYNQQLHELVKKEAAVLSTNQLSAIITKNDSVVLDKPLYLRSRLLDFIVANYNKEVKSYAWIMISEEGVKKIVPYINNYQNQFMLFDGSYALATKFIKSYKHLESYTPQVKNIKKVSEKSIGFDVNMLSELPFEVWEKEVSFIQDQLNEEAISFVKSTMPKGMLSTKTETIFEVLQHRISNLDQIAKTYYNLIAPNKIVRATNANNLIVVHRVDDGTTVKIYNEKAGKKNPIAQHVFKDISTKEIWVYGLKGNDYFEVVGNGSHQISIKLIGGNQSDKYELQNGKNVVVFDSAAQTFIVEKDNAKIRLLEDEYITKYNNKKYAHKQNNLKPAVGANPDDGIFVGLTNELLSRNFEGTEFSKKHQLSAAFYIGNLGFSVGYYGELVNVYKGFNAFAELGYKSPNYSTNFFGFGNETPNFDDNLKLDYNRVRMASFDAKVGLLKRNKDYFTSANLFFESRKIDETPERFVSSETLFFPDENFFDRKNYVGLSVAYEYKKLSVSMVEDLLITPKINLKVTADIAEFSNTNAVVSPSVFVAHPLYGEKIRLDATIAYEYVFGEHIPFYQAATIGGNSGLRGYRNQRFVGESFFYTSTNIKWHIKELRSDVLPLQFGVLGGFDVGRVWVEEVKSSVMHTSFGGGFWLQTANLLKAQMQAFGADEGLRFSFNLSVGF